MVRRAEVTEQGVGALTAPLEEPAIAEGIEWRLYRLRSGMKTDGNGVVRFSSDEGRHNVAMVAASEDGRTVILTGQRCPNRRGAKSRCRQQAFGHCEPVSAIAQHQRRM
ncbi:DUF1131 family protein [Salmonella enterica subsp. enterica]|nr:DUF1131 family protein [Salmonella enterica subsp. enterica]